MVDRCVMCGEIIPEGRQICPICEKGETKVESPKWIPVTERLPEKDVLVLCIGAKGGMFLGKTPWLFSDSSAFFDVPNSRRARYAIYWMPLPEPPKGE